MRFKTGIAIGTALGWWLGTRSSEQQRADIDRLVQKVRGEPHLGQVKEAVGRTVGQTADAATERVVGATGPTGDRMASSGQTSGQPSAQPVGTDAPVA